VIEEEDILIKLAERNEENLNKSSIDIIKLFKEVYCPYDKHGFKKKPITINNQLDQIKLNI
jgi:hypothetical protein